VPVEPLGIENMGKLAAVLYKMSTNVELQISNELSSLKAMDFYGTISSEKSTGNASKKIRDGGQNVVTWRLRLFIWHH
jgi:hypothetical protein